MHRFICAVQFLKATQADGAVIVTTPQEVSIIDVRKEVNFCKKVGIPILGVVENMSGLQQSVEDCRFVDTSSGQAVDVTEKALQALQQALPNMGTLQLHATVSMMGFAKGVFSYRRKPTL